MPLVTVIMPSLNVVEYIEDCLKSVVNQTLKDIEIICIDAGSTDGTLDIIQKYADLDNRIIVINSKVRSYGYQVNIGIEAANGEYIAILETDDWINCDMYEKLYNLAFNNNLDYVAADFDFVYELRNKNVCYQRYKQFPIDTYMYNIVLLQEDINKLRTSDYVLWKGIYNKDFLLKNNIRLHESPKAAYQDMGFLQQVKTYANRAMYIDKSFYRYRLGRLESSTCSIDGLIFYMNEFLWINSELRLLDKMTYIQKAYYYHTMSVAFYLKYKELLVKLNWNYSDERLSFPYKWFSKQLRKAIVDRILIKELYHINEWNELTLLLKSQQEYTAQIKYKYEIDMNNYLSWENSIQGKKVIIFGCGKIGLRTLRVCDRRNINIEKFVDNNKAVQKNGFNGYQVVSVNEIKKCLSIENYIIILAVKNNKKEIINQLRDSNIECDIIDYPSDIVLK